MKLSVKGLELAKSLVGKSNPNCSSDLGVAALNLLACSQGVWLNILTNLSGIKDPEREQSFRDGGMKLYQQTETWAHEIYEEVKNGL
jgi:formiminotetrahydrofolate cyclodeaminase